MPASFEDLVALMARLRSPEGCPWDREQNYATLAPMLLEEAYEAFEAVEEAVEGRTAELRDELGDLLFQVVFYAQVAGERGDFKIEDVTEAIHSKMVRRHPHVFGEARAENSAEVLRNWEAIKAEEKRSRGVQKRREDSGLLDGVSTRVPALMEAHQLSNKASRVGFDWKRLEDIFDELHEEIDELKEAIDHSGKSGSREEDHFRVSQEVGDLLFAVTNIARFLKVEPESALKSTNRKFRRRFSHIERRLKEDGKTFDQVTLDEMEALWQEAKQSEIEAKTQTVKMDGREGVDS
jgi:MazG family protein